MEAAQRKATRQNLPREQLPDQLLAAIAKISTGQALSDAELDGVRDSLRQQQQLAQEEEASGSGAAAARHQLINQAEGILRDAEAFAAEAGLAPPAFAAEDDGGAVVSEVSEAQPVDAATGGKPAQQAPMLAGAAAGAVWPAAKRKLELDGFSLPSSVQQLLSGQWPAAAAGQQQPQLLAVQQQMSAVATALAGISAEQASSAGAAADKAINGAADVAARVLTPLLTAIKPDQLEAQLQLAFGGFGGSFGGPVDGGKPPPGGGGGRSGGSGDGNGDDQEQPSEGQGGSGDGQGAGGDGAGSGGSGGNGNSGQPSGGDSSRPWSLDSPFWIWAPVACCYVLSTLQQALRLLAPSSTLTSTTSTPTRAAYPRLHGSETSRRRHSGGYVPGPISLELSALLADPLLLQQLLEEHLLLGPVTAAEAAGPQAAMPGEPVFLPTRPGSASSSGHRVLEASGLQQLLHGPPERQVPLLLQALRASVRQHREAQRELSRLQQQLLLQAAAAPPQGGSVPEELAIAGAVAAAAAAAAAVQHQHQHQQLPADAPAAEAAGPGGAVVPEQQDDVATVPEQQLSEALTANAQLQQALADAAAEAAAAEVALLQLQEEAAAAAGAEVRALSELSSAREVFEAFRANLESQLAEEQEKGGRWEAQATQLRGQVRGCGCLGCCVTCLNAYDCFFTACDCFSTACGGM